VDDLIAQVKRILGTDKVWNVLLVGAGNLGRALMAYKGFNAKGFRLTHVFDANSQLAGKRVGPFTVQPMGELAETIQKDHVRLAMIAIPADHAQGVVDQLVAAGIRGILNFAPTSVTVPPHIALNAVDLSVQLEQLSFQVNFGGQAPVNPLPETGS
jgi:redox-sensing transcriptional repressor